MIILSLVGPASGIAKNDIYSSESYSLLKTQLNDSMWRLDQHVVDFSVHGWELLKISRYKKFDNDDWLHWIGFYTSSPVSPDGRTGYYIGVGLCVDSYLSHTKYVFDMLDRGMNNYVQFVSHYQRRPLGFILQDMSLESIGLTSQDVERVASFQQQHRETDGLGSPSAYARKRCSNTDFRTFDTFREIYEDSQSRISLQKYGEIFATPSDSLLRSALRSELSQKTVAEELTQRIVPAHQKPIAPIEDVVSGPLPVSASHVPGNRVSLGGLLDKIAGLQGTLLDMSDRLSHIEKSLNKRRTGIWVFVAISFVLISLIAVANLGILIFPPPLSLTSRDGAGQIGTIRGGDGSQTRPSPAGGANIRSPIPDPFKMNNYPPQVNVHGVTEQNTRSILPFENPVGDGRSTALLFDCRKNETVEIFNSIRNMARRVSDASLSAYLLRLCDVCPQSTLNQPKTDQKPLEKRQNSAR